MQEIVLAGGCFWCLDAAYRVVDGVEEVVSGYTGGSVAHPSYDLVCTGTTGHAEAVKVVYDEAKVPTDVVLDMYFTMHDPRQLNRQGNDVGTQYRSAMFYRDDAERERFEAAIERASEWWPGEIVTTLEPLGEFYAAEEHHQDFFAKNPTQGYCLAVAAPKVNKIRAGSARAARRGILRRMNDAITVVGALGGDPTLKSVNGDRVAEFRLGCTARRKEGEEWVDGHTNWYSIEAWGGFADHVGSSLRKGDVVMVLGKLKVDQWESGEKRGTSVKIRAEHVGHSLRIGPTTRERRTAPTQDQGDPGFPQESQQGLALAGADHAAGQSGWSDPAVAIHDAA